MALMSLTGWAQTADLLDADVSFSHIQYGGGFPVMQVLYKGQVLEQGTHFTWDGKYYTDAACETVAATPLAVTGEGEKYYVKLIGKEGTVYENSATKGWFTVEPADLKITAIANVEKDYDGAYSDIEVSFDDITFDGFVLEEDEDDLTVADHIYVQYGPANDPKAINAGEYTITGITGITSGNYNISLNLSPDNKAKINGINFPEDAFAIEGAEVVYSAAAATFPEIVTELTEDDYTIAWYDNVACEGDAIPEAIHVGDYYAKITGKGNYAKEGNEVTNEAWKLTITRKAVMAYVQNAEKVYNGEAANLENAEIVFNGLYAADNALKEQFFATWVDEPALGGNVNVGEYAMVPATEAGELDAETGIINAEGFGDYTFNLLNTGVYEITKRPVTVTAKDQEFEYNGEEQAIVTEISAETVAITAATDNTGLVGEDNLATISELFTISLKEGVVIKDKANAAYAGAILINPQVVANANYSINPVAGNVVMGGKALVLIAGTFEKVYGYPLNNADFSVVNTGGLKADDWKEAPTFTVSQGENTYDVGDVLNPGVYTIAISNAEDIIPDNFTFTNTEGVDLFTGELTITAKPIEITINDVRLNSGDDAEVLNKYASCVDYSDQLVKADDALDFSYEFVGEILDEGALKTADQLGDALVDGVLADAVNGVLTASTEADPNDNAKYIITFAKGDIILGAANSLVLDPTDTQLAGKIADAAEADGGNDVSFANLTMRANEWYAMVLPFEVDPKEMVLAANRYVIFNTLNEAGTTAESFKFTLKFSPIEAGTPFLIKFAGEEGEDVDWSTFGGEAGVAFAGVDISNVIKPTETDYVTFKGTYASDITLQGSRTNGSENYVWWLCDKSYKDGAKGNNWLKPISAPHKLNPMEAYLDGNESEWTGYAPKITVEDFDGQTTSIKSISVEQIHNMTVDGLYNMNGMKMQSAPTQKGVYIQNGKKVVIK